MQGSYVEVEMNASAELVENLIGVLSQIGFEGFWEDGIMLKCYISENRWSPEMLEEVQATIGRMTRTSADTRPKLVVRNVENRNWNEEWEKTIKPIQVSDHIVIVPTWHQYAPTPGEIVLTIVPKMSFGTGYHETTRLVLRLMEKYVKPGMSVLDIGTGTGVLAIAAVKLGAAAATGIDVDEWSFDNALENVRLNHVDQSTKIIYGDLASVPVGMFELIVANIQLNVIIPMLAQMKERLTPDGVLILSGLLLPDREQIVRAFLGLELQVVGEIAENEWIAIVAGNAR